MISSVLLINLDPRHSWDELPLLGFDEHQGSGSRHINNVFANKKGGRARASAHYCDRNTTIPSMYTSNIRVHCAEADLSRLRIKFR